MARRVTVEVFDPASTRVDLTLSLSLMLRPMVYRPVCLGIKAPVCLSLNPAFPYRIEDTFSRGCIFSRNNLVA
jgi:hypothetical protein